MQINNWRRHKKRFCQGKSAFQTDKPCLALKRKSWIIFLNLDSVQISLLGDNFWWSLPYFNFYRNWGAVFGPLTHFLNWPMMIPTQYYVAEDANRSIRRWWSWFRWWLISKLTGRCIMWARRSPRGCKSCMECWIWSPAAGVSDYVSGNIGFWAIHCPLGRWWLSLCILQYWNTEFDNILLSRLLSHNTLVTLIESIMQGRLSFLLSGG